MHILSEKDVEAYDRDGAICLRGIFSAEWIDLAVKGIEKSMQSPGIYSERLTNEQGPGAYFDDYCNWRSVPEFQKIACESPAAEIVGLLMKSSTARFYHEHVLVKEPGTFRETPWHQDQPYYPIDGWKVCSIWMPVDPITEDTCVQFVAGSHRWGDWYIPKKFATTLHYEIKDPTCQDRVYKPAPEITGNEEKYTILKWRLEPGDCIVFHMRTLHGAPGNESLERSRRILSTRWLGDDAKIARRPWEPSPPLSALLQPGQDVASEAFPLIWENCHKS